MPHSEVHNKKRRKNLITLALIFGWCLLIYVMSMVKMAHSHGIPDRYKNQRETHQEAIEEQWKEFDEQGEEHRKAVDEQGNSWWYGDAMSDQAKEIETLKNGSQFEWESDEDYEARMNATESSGETGEEEEKADHE